jgi:hypothetical protein
MRNAWGIPMNYEQDSSKSELDEHAMLKKAVMDAINKLELSQHSQTNAPKGRLLAWEALQVLREATK